MIDTLAVRIVANELGRMPEDGKRSEFGEVRYNAHLHILRRLLSPTGEASEISEEQAKAWIPTFENIGAHSQSVYFDVRKNHALDDLLVSDQVVVQEWWRGMWDTWLRVIKST